MDLLDPQGRPIRTFTGTPADAERKPPAPGSDDGGARRPPEPHPAVSAGLHPVNWDMRYTGAVDFPGMVMWAAGSRGPQSPPDSYSVRVTAERTASNQTLAVKREPHG